MERYLIPAGLLLNALLITLNRYWKRFPSGLYLPGLMVGFLLILAGAVARRG